MNYAEREKNEENHVTSLNYAFFIKYAHIRQLDGLYIGSALSLSQQRNNGRGEVELQSDSLVFYTDGSCVEDGNWHIFGTK